VTLGEVLGLSVGQRRTNVYRCQFIPSANTARQNLILSRNRIEEPLPRAILLQWDREGKIVSSDEQDFGSIRLGPPVLHRVVYCRAIATMNFSSGEIR
jgi:hypothetical protein